jgi:hypothetical protein
VDGSQPRDPQSVGVSCEPSVLHLRDRLPSHIAGVPGLHTLHVPALQPRPPHSLFLSCPVV